MATDTKTQQTLEPVHVRTEPQQISGTSETTSEPARPEAIETKPKPTPILKPQPQPKAKKTAQRSGNGVGGAIAATVIIVFGLAALAVYAYIKTKHN